MSTLRHLYTYATQYLPQLPYYLQVDKQAFKTL